MTKEELNKRILEIQDNAERERQLAYAEYVKTNHRYNLGDIVTDICSGKTIRIESIGYGARSFLEIFYTGPVLTKKGEPRKDGACYKVYEEYARQL